MLGFWSPRGPRVPMAWGGCVGAAGYPMGCQIGRLTRHETPLARPSQATKISKPNRFAYPFRSRPRGVGSPLWLNSPAAKTSSYRDMANLGLGVRPRRSPAADGLRAGLSHSGCHGIPKGAYPSGLTLARSALSTFDSTSTSYHPGLREKAE